MRTVMKKLDFQQILIFLFLVSVVLLSIVKIEDTDTWMHLSLGRLIWERRGLPAKEVFAYPSLQMPFLYTSWLFAVLYYVIYKLFSVSGVILLMASTVFATFFILLKDALRPYKNTILTVVVMSLAVLIMRDRFVERPDTFFFLFLSFNIFSLNAYVQDNKKYLYTLPLVNLLWANVHSSIGMMFVPFGSFIAGGLIQRYLGEKGFKFSFTPSSAQLKTISMIFAASFAASLINPNFIGQYTFGSQMLGAFTWYEQEIMELQPPTWEAWKPPYIIVFVTLSSFLINWAAVYRTKRKVLTILPDEETTPPTDVFPSLIHLFLLVPFIYLSFTAIRFLFPLAVVSAPILIRNVSPVLDPGRLRKPFLKRFFAAATALWILSYAPLVLAHKMQVVPGTNERKVFGIGINYSTVPEGALKYMDDKNIYGRVFNLFEWGGYIVWRDFPKRSVFIDPRGYIPPDLLEAQGRIGKAGFIEKLEARYGFEAVLIRYPRMAPTVAAALDPEKDEALSNIHWALVYWDDNALLYLKRGGRYQAVIDRDEYRYARPANDIPNQRSRLENEDTRMKMMREFLRNANETGSSRAYFLLGYAYKTGGLYREALTAFSRALRSSYADRFVLYGQMADTYLLLGDSNEALRYFKKSIALEENAEMLYTTGVLYMDMGKKKESLKYLNRAIDKNPNLLSAYGMLTSIYKESGMKDELAEVSKKYHKALVQSSGKEHFEKGLKYYVSGELTKAIDEFMKSIELNPSNPMPYADIGFVYFDMGDLDKAIEYHNKALDIDPGTAISHYGLALIYKMRKENEKAAKHFEAYLKIEPRGYYSRQAFKNLQELR
jgi:tetratricopeptide (TPR) repeat protein